MVGIRRVSRDRGGGEEETGHVVVETHPAAQVSHMTHHMTHHMTLT